MELKNQLQEFAKRVPQLKEMTSTEEATKNAFVMPFLRMLGYDVFNPAEVVPEFISDVGTKKGEKVDYALIHEGVPTVIIECKHWRENLNNHDNQLTRYFQVSTVRFGILTNGVEYRFYTDLEKSNIKDEKPFFEFSFENLKESTYHGVKKFLKEGFDLDQILDDASSLKYNKIVKETFAKLSEEPTDDLIKILAADAYPGKFTQKVLDQFREIVKRSISTYISERISDRLESALHTQREEQKETVEAVEEKAPLIETTDDELKAFHIIQAIGSAKTDPSNITIRDAQSYCSIFFDDNNRKPIARLHFNGKTKFVEVFNASKQSEKYPIENVNEIYKWSSDIHSVVESYVQ